MTEQMVDATWKGLYMAGGIAFMITGILYIIGTILFASLGGFPASGQAALTAIPGVKLQAQATTTIFALSDFLLIPAVLALYLSLTGVRKTYALLATALVGLFIVIDLGVNTVNFFNLIALSDKYAAATADGQRAAIIAAADLTLNTIAVGITMATVASVGILIYGLAMLKGVFNKATAYLAIAAGIVGIISGIPTPALGVFFPITLILTAIFFFLAGWKLYKLG